MQMERLAKVSGYALVAALMIAGSGTRGAAQSHDDHGGARSEPHKPTPQEIRNCAPFLATEIQLLKRLRVVVALGRIAFDGYLNFLIAQGVISSRREYAFAHGAEHRLPNGMILLASYHPSLRNTNTGRLNKAQFTRVFVRARELAGL